LAYLADILEALNTMDLKLQGRNITIISHYDSLQPFMARQLWNQQVHVRICTTFPQLDEAVKDKGLENDIKESPEPYLVSLHDEFQRYIPDVITENPVWKLVRNPFSCEVQFLPDETKKFLELKFETAT
jgi:hypothetical protein